jgi:DNA-binding SARP family transcriptional activator
MRMVVHRPELAIRLFGNFAMEVDGEPFVMATPRRTLPILAYLLLNRGTAVSREFLAYFMWPDESETSARTKLRANLHDLARVLPPAPAGYWIAADGDNVAWNSEARLRLDIEEFEACCADPERREEGVQLYRGELLATLYDEWIFVPRERYRNLYLATLTELISEARRRRDFPRAIARAQELLVVDPWREDVVRRLIAVRYESGDRSGALVEYQRFAARLHAELNIEPMPETVALRDAIGRDESIDPPSPPRAYVSPSAASSPSLPFVGRESEIELLTEAWNRAARGNGAAVFVGGESGIGKSRLALAFAHRVEELGGRILSGTTGMPEAMPYQGIVESLRSALPLVASLRVRDVWLAGVASLVPELRSHLPALPHLTRIAADGERPRIFEALAGTLAALAGPRPLLLVIEDVQWAEEATSAAIEFLLGRISAMRVLVVLTYRDDELPRLHPMQRLRRDAVLAGHARSISLRPLGLDDVEALARSLPSALGGSPAELHATSDGNPLFLTLLVEGGSGALGGGASASLRSLVARRLDALTPQTRTIAEIASLVGTQFSREVVCRVSGWDGAATDAALDELIERRIVREASGRGFFDYAFSHHLVQRTVAESAEEGRAAARHRRIARALDELYPERAAELAPRIARHYDLGGDARAAAHWYLAAARRALVLGALDEAAGHVARGLESSDDAATRIALLFVKETVAARRIDKAARGAALDELNAVSIASGDGEGLRMTLLRRAAFAHERHDREDGEAALSELRRLVAPGIDALWLGRLCAAEAQQFIASDDSVAAESSAEAALAAFIEAGAQTEEAEARRRLADVLTLRGDLGRAETLFEEARLAGERTDDAMLSLRALKGLYQFAFYRGDAQRCFEIARAQVDLGIASGDRRAEAEGYCAMANAANFLRSRGGEALEHLRAATAIFAEVGDHVGTAVSLVQTGVTQIAVGELAGALDSCQRAMQIYAVHPPQARLRITGLLTLSIATHLCGDGPAAAVVAREAVALTREVGFRLLEAAALGNLADAEAASGDYAAAIVHMGESLATWAETDQADRNVGVGSANLAVWSARVGDLTAARRYAERALECQATFAAINFWPQSSYWEIAQAFRACGDAEAAAGALGTAYSLTQNAVEQLDEAQRDMFLSLPWHRELIAAAERDVWPSFLEQRPAGITDHDHTSKHSRRRSDEKKRGNPKHAPTEAGSSGLASLS